MSLLLIAPSSMAAEAKFRVFQMASSAALVDGDEAAAVEFAYSAWQSAERERGDSRVTAALAYLYAKLAIVSDVETAYQALRRAKKLEETGKADLYEQDLELYYAYADLVSGRFLLSEARAFLEARAGMAGRNTESELSVIWDTAATDDYPVDKHVERLQQAAAIYAPEVGPIPVDARSVARALMFRGAVRIISPDSSRQDLIAADQDFILACSLLPEPESASTYDPMRAQSVAWQILALGLNYRNNDTEKRTDPSYAKLEGVSCNWQTKIGDIEFARGCEYHRWKPALALFDNLRKPGDFYGAVLYAYRLDRDLNMLEPRILAEVPKTRHSSETLDALTGNRIDADDVDRACHQDVLSWWYYVTTRTRSLIDNL